MHGDWKATGRRIFTVAFLLGVAMMFVNGVWPDAHGVGVGAWTVALVVGLPMWVFGRHPARTPRG